MYKAKIKGNSMQPTFSDGEIVYFRKAKRYKKGDIVIAKWQGILLVKRIARITKDEVFLKGDNITSMSASVPLKNIKGKYYSESGLKALSNKIYCDLLKKWGG